MTEIDDTPTASSLVMSMRSIRRSWAQALANGDMPLAQRLRSQHDQFARDLRNILDATEDAMDYFEKNTSQVLADINSAD